MESPKRNLSVGNEVSAETNKAQDKSTNEQFTLGLSQETLLSALDELLKDAVKKEKERQQKVSDGEVAEDDISVSDIDVFLQLTWIVPPKKDMLRPKAIPLKHTLKNENDEVIFFVKDPQRLMKDYLARHGNGGVTRILGVEKLRKRYGTHEGRRELLRQYDRFLVDARVAPMMLRLLGKAFVTGKHMPMSVDVKHDIPAAIRRALDSTAFCPRRGTCCTIRVARADFPVEHVVENVNAVLDYIIPKQPRGWRTIQSLHIKTTRSPALPIYVALPEMPKPKPKPKPKTNLKASAHYALENAIARARNKMGTQPWNGKRKAETELKSEGSSGKKPRGNDNQSSDDGSNQKKNPELAKEMITEKKKVVVAEDHDKPTVVDEVKVPVRNEPSGPPQGILTSTNHTNQSTKAPKNMGSDVKETVLTPVSGENKACGKENIQNNSQSNSTRSTKGRSKRSRRMSSEVAVES